jgi:hypothetical protein
MYYDNRQINQELNQNIEHCQHTTLFINSISAPDQKYLESFEMWWWRRMEKISWTDHVRNEAEEYRT